MTKQKEPKKQNRLTINKETIADLEVKHDDKVKGGTVLITVDDPITRPATGTSVNCIIRPH